MRIDRDLPKYLQTPECESTGCDFDGGICYECGEEEMIEKTEEDEELPAPKEFYTTMGRIASEYEKTGKWNLNLLLNVNQALHSTSPTRWDDFKDKLRAEIEIAQLSLRRVYDDHGHSDDASCCEECAHWDKEMERRHTDSH